MADNQRDADIINEDRRKQAASMKEHLEKMGVEVTIAPYRGDASYPIEFALSYGSTPGGIQASGPTLDLALLSFIEKLLPKGRM